QHGCVIIIGIGADAENFVFKRKMLNLFQNGSCHAGSGRLAGYRQAVNYIEITIAMPLALNFIVGRFSVQDNGYISNEFVSGFIHITLVLRNIVFYGLQIRIAVLPLRGALFFSQLYSAAQDVPDFWNIVWICFSEGGSKRQYKSKK